MDSSNKRIAKKVAKTGVRTIGDIIALIFKIIGSVILIFITTGIIFACIFVMYIKTNLSSGLDVNLEDFTLNQSSVIGYEDPNTGQFKELVTIQTTENRIWVDYNELPKYLEYATVAIEDKRFYRHNGVDWSRTASAAVNMFLGMRDTFGGSTITQQLIKNLTHRDEVTVQRKLQEILVALEFEKDYDKKQIIEWYLNAVNFGGVQYGVGAAAQYYFNKDVSELTLAECASIIGITNNPSMYSPYINPEANKERQEDILGEMVDQGYITQAEYQEAKAQKLVFASSDDDDDSTTDSDTYTWFEETVIEDVIDGLMSSKNCSYETAEMMLSNGGYTIYTTLNPEIQAAIDKIYTNLDEIPDTYDTDQQLLSAIVIIDPYTGDIVGLSGGVGTKEGNRLFNLATDAERPPGSSIKPLSVYAPAMDLGLITPDTRYDDSSSARLRGTTWMPENYERSYRGVLTVRQAIMYSVNTIAAQIMDDLSPSVSYDFLTEKLGFTTLLEGYDDNYAPLSLGEFTNGATVREMATAYTMFPNAGIRMKSRTYTHVFDSDGKAVLLNDSDGVIAISDTTAYWMIDIMRGSAYYGADYNTVAGVQVAGKTGTSSDNRDRWFVGYTPYYVAAVWTGYRSPEYIYADGNPAAQLWEKVMYIIHENLPDKDFFTPSSTYQAPVPGISQVGYFVRGVTEDGKTELYTDSGTAVPGNVVTITAREIEKYKLVTTESVVQLTISSNESQNVVQFVYAPLEEPSPSPSGSPGPSPSGDPSPSPSGGEPSPSPSVDPSPSPSSDPEPSPSASDPEPSVSDIPFVSPEPAE